MNRENSDQSIHSIDRFLVLATWPLMALTAMFVIGRLDRFGLILKLNDDAISLLTTRTIMDENEASTRLYAIQRIFVEGLSWIVCLCLNQRSRYLFIFWLFNSLLAIYFLLSLTKIKFLLFILSHLMVRNWYRYINLYKILRTFILGFLILLLMWQILVKNNDIEYLFSVYSEGLVGRILISEISSLYAHFNIFSNSDLQIGMLSLSKSLSWLVDLEPIKRSGRVVLEIASPSWVEAGYGGVYNTVFFGEAYANFGLIGIIISPFIVLLNYYLITKIVRKMPDSVAPAVFVFTGFNLNVMSGFNDFIWNPNLWLILFIVNVSTWCLVRVKSK